MTRQKQRKPLKSATWDAIAGVSFSAPFIIGFLLFFVSPMIMYVVMAFSKLILNDAGNMAFLPVGWANYYEALFVRENYLKEVFSSLGDLMIMFPSVLLFSLFIAMLLNQNFRGRTLTRAIFFLPVLIASGVAAVGQMDALTTTAVSAISGVSSDTGSTLNLTKTLMQMVGASMDAGFFKIVETLITKVYNITMASGVQILIFLAGLQTISPSLYEASSIEGATAWEKFWKITLPMISPIILVNAVYTVVDILGSASNTVVNDLYELSMGDSNFGLSAAMGTIYFGIMFAIVGLVIFIISRMVFYEEN